MLKDYFQHRYVHRHLLPLLRRFNFQYPVLDIGSGRGGVLLAMADGDEYFYAEMYYGIDVNIQSVNFARIRRDSANIPLSTMRFLNMPVEVYPYSADTILICDTIEHTGLSVLKHAKKIITETGLIYISFPPWRSPFGGHQQTCKGLVKFPWIHLLKCARLKMIRTARNAEDVVSAARCTISPSKVKAEVAELGLRIIYSRKYILRPELARYGIPTIPAPKWWPDWLSTGWECVVEEGQKC